MISTSTTTGWAIRRKSDGLLGTFDLDGDTLLFLPNDQADPFCWDTRYIAETLLRWNQDCEVVPITRTVTVEIGAAET